jgi:phytanoyl-CoA hydroxylase
MTFDIDPRQLAELPAWSSQTGPSFIAEPTLGADGTMRAFYEKNGYLVVPGALNETELRQLHSEALAICKGERGPIEGTEGDLTHETDDEVLSRFLCIHFPHKISSVMKRYLATPEMVAVLEEIVGPNVKCMQSMLFIKSSGKPGQAWHQDEDFIPTRDRSLVGGWIALDDATIENGCLWIIPGSHRHGVLWPLEQQLDPRFDCTEEAAGFPYTDDDAIPVEVKAGSIVFFNGYTLHRSLPNRARRGYRRVLVNHYMSAESLLPWQRPGEGEPMAVVDYRDIVIVAGIDPYHWKGTADIAKPKVRPTLQGGCENWNSEVEPGESGD